MCGLKLVESQLLASLAAANARSDASTLRAQRLAAALETATAKLTAAATASERTSAAAGGAGAVAGASGAGGGGAAVRSAADGGSSLAVQVAQLQAQLLARDQELYDLQDQLVQVKQVSAGQCVWGGGYQVETRKYSKDATWPCCCKAGEADACWAVWVVCGDAVVCCTSSASSNWCEGDSLASRLGSVKPET